MTRKDSAEVRVPGAELRMGNSRQSAVGSRQWEGGEKKMDPSLHSG